MAGSVFIISNSLFVNVDLLCAAIFFLKKESKKKIFLNFHRGEKNYKKALIWTTKTTNRSRLYFGVVTIFAASNSNASVLRTC
jgi:hypothetical protein